MLLIHVKQGTHASITRPTWDDHHVHITICHSALTSSHFLSLLVQNTHVRRQASDSEDDDDDDDESDAERRARLAI